MNLQFAIEASIFVLFTWIVLELAYVDHFRNLLPDRLTLSLLATGLLVNVNGLFTPFPDAVLGALTAYLCFRLYHFIRFRMTGTASIGLGDGKYLTALAAWFGIQAVPFLLLGASICSLIGYRRRSEIPFGVGLSISAVGVWIFAALSADLLQ